MAHVKNGQVYLIPASSETRGHGTNVFARLWAAQLRQFMEGVPAKTQ